MDIFVTGGNGFIGSVVVRKLTERGHTVRCLLREKSQITRLEGLAYRRVSGDVRDAASVRSGLSGADGVIHLAGLSSWTDIQSPLMPDVVIGGTKNVLEAAASLGRPRMVFVSSSAAVNGTSEPIIHDEDSVCTLPLNRFTYAKAKREGERLCREHAAKGLPVSIVNPAEVYGPNDYDQITSGSLVDFARSSPVMVSRGGTSVVHVDDVAEGVIAALERGRPGERYILGGDNLSVRELAELTLEILGRGSRSPRRIVSVPNRLLTSLCWLARTLHIPMPFNPAVIPYAVLYWFMDNGKAKRELGLSFRPARAVLEPTLDWIEANLLPAGPERVGSTFEG